MRPREIVPLEVKSVLNRVKGMPFRWSINPYRGCSHGCVFCYARRTHWFLNEDGVNEWSSKIFVKVNAAEVLRRELSRPGWRREEVALGTATDPYQAIEGQYRITRGILETLRDYKTPVSIVTRCPLILRDADLLREMANVAGATVCISIATMNQTLAREIEPTVAPPAQRMRAVRALVQRGVRTGVLLAPVLPGLTDDPEGLAAVLRSAAEAGSCFVWHRVLYLGDVTRDAFHAFLTKRYPRLLPLYQTLYAGQYAPRAYRSAIGRLLTQERSRIDAFAGDLKRPRDRRTDVPAAVPEQLSLGLSLGEASVGE